MRRYFTKSNVQRSTIDIGIMVIGSFLYAISINMFSSPNNIAPGGATGIATMINYITDMPIGVLSILINIPIFIWAIIEVDLAYVFKTGVALIISSIIIDVTEPLMSPFVFTEDKLLASLFGGVIGGIGMGLMFMRGYTTGGTDLAASLAGRRLRHISIGKLILVIDLVVIVTSGIVYKSYLSPMYAIIYIFIFIQLVDMMIYGTSSGSGKMMFIISPKNREIEKIIMERLDRGITALKSRGAYSNIEGEVLLCAVRRQEVYKVYDIVHKIDPRAFIIVGASGEISGEGFKEKEQANK